jgi:uncharacterized membrane protein
MMDIFVVMLRFLHIVSAAIWVGSAVMLAFFVEPAAAAAGPAGGQFMLRLGQGKFSPAVTIAAVLTVGAGFLLYWRFGYSLNSVTGTVLLGGGLVGLVALIFGAVVTWPAAAALGRLGGEIQSGGKPPTTEQMQQMTGLVAKQKRDAHITAGLVLVAVAAMAVARYL